MRSFENMVINWIPGKGDIAVIWILYIIVGWMYNLYFHPLAKFPGPFWARASLLWRFWHTMRGRSHRVIEQQHRKYDNFGGLGRVFRVSPNELSFASVESWQDIYGYPPSGQAQLIKGDFYDTFGAGYQVPCIGSERNPKKHSAKKKTLTAAFSAKALNAQEDIVQKCWDDFITEVGHASQQSPNGVNVVHWLEMVTFDVLGEMAFGESFGCVKNGNHHFWIDLILQHLMEVTFADNLRRFHLISILFNWIMPSLTARFRREHSKYSRAKVKRRLESSNARQDFLTNLVSKVKTGEVSREQLTAHASTLIIAGGETTAVALSSAIYHLLKNPATLMKLNEEVRNRFQNYNEITAKAVANLPYLHAVINEALRIHPPGSQGFPRLSPGVTIDGQYVPAGVEVYTSAWAVTHDPKYFHEPMAFKPDRWIDPNSIDEKEASQPFSLGYRACIGQNFAWMQMTLCLAKLVFKYEWELVDKDLNWEASSRSYISWWKAPIHIRLQERNLGNCNDAFNPIATAAQQR